MNTYEKILNALKDETLTNSERTRMKNELRYFMAEHPLQIRTVPSSTFESFTLAFTSFNFRPAAFALVLVLCAGVGTSYAAEKALPGDPLYSVKIHVNEPAEGALALSSSEKANWNAELASRRLEETESLALEGRLTQTAHASIDAQLDEVTKNFDNSVQLLQESPNNSAAVADAQSNLEASLKAHEHLLTQISVQTGTSDLIQPIIEKVRARIEIATASRINAESALAVENSDTTHTAAVATKKDAEAQIEEVRALAKDTGSDLDPKATAQVGKDASQADGAITSGEQHLNAGEYAKAFTKFQTASRAAHETKVGLNAHLRLKGKVLVPSVAVSAASSDDANSQTHPTAPTIMMKAATPRPALMHIESTTISAQATSTESATTSEKTLNEIIEN